MWPLHFRVFTLVSQRFTTRQLSTIPAFLWKSFSFFCSFQPQIKTSVDRWNESDSSILPRPLWCCFNQKLGGAVVKAGLQQRHHVLSVCVALGRQRHQLVRLREDDHWVRRACRRWRRRVDSVETGSWENLWEGFHSPHFTSRPIKLPTWGSQHGVMEVHGLHWRGHVVAVGLQQAALGQRLSCRSKRRQWDSAGSF